MNTDETFYWGCVGGICGYVAAFLFPWLRELWELADRRIKVSPRRLVLCLCIGIPYVFLGGIAALLIAKGAEPKQAIAAGIASETLIKAGTEAPRPSNRRRPPKPRSKPPPKR
jgi:hypothetical protein